MGLWRAAGTWHRERPWEAVGKDTASVTGEIQGLNWPWGVVEAWHLVAGPEFLKRTQETLLVQLSCRWRSNIFGDAGTMATTKDSSTCGVQPAWSHEKSSCVLRMAELGKGSPSETRGLWVGPRLCPDSSPGERNYITYFWFYRSPQLREFVIL